MRPCENDHPLSPDTCDLCKGYADPGPLGEGVRAFWAHRAQLRQQAGTTDPGPGLFQKAWNLAGAAVHHTAGCFANASEALKARRLAVCRGDATGYCCEMYNPEKGICVHPSCGCNMKVKVGWLEQKCPLRKWPGEPEAAVQDLLLHNGQSPGDLTVMTAALEMLHRQYPGRFVTAVDSPCPAVFENNPFVVPAHALGPERRKIEMEYPLINESGQRPVHFLQGFVEFLGMAVGLPLQLTVNRPSLYLTDEEKAWGGRLKELCGPRDFWLINAGVKDDYTAKGYGRHNYQEVVNALKGKVRFVQVGDPLHLHKPLEGCVNLLGKTNSREFIVLGYHARGGVGPSTWLQHVLAAFEKPYVCLAGGRESKSWLDYPTQATLSTVGQMDCCRSGGCWKRHTVPRPGGGGNQDVCSKPVLTGEEPVPACLESFTPARVAEEVLRFYGGGVCRHDDAAD